MPVLHNMGAALNQTKFSLLLNFQFSSSCVLGNPDDVHMLWVDLELELSSWVKARMTVDLSESEQGKSARSRLKWRSSQGLRGGWTAGQCSVCSNPVGCWLNQKAKLPIYRSIFIPILTYGHEFLKASERRRIPELEMGFRCRVVEHTLRDGLGAQSPWRRGRRDAAPLQGGVQPRCYLLLEERCSRPVPPGGGPLDDPGLVAEGRGSLTQIQDFTEFATFWNLTLKKKTHLDEAIY